MRSGRLRPTVGAVRPWSRREARQAAAALRSLIASMQALARRQGSVLTELLGRGAAMPAWTHVPANDARDPRSGYRWYYHAHPGNGRWPAEHGHFHLFADPHSAADVTHLLAIAVDGRGLPLGLVAPNRWVTDERWRPASSVQRAVERFSMSTPRAFHRVHRWLAQILVAFAPQVRALLAHRDARLRELRHRLGGGVLEDRRIAVLSRCRIDLQAQAELLDRSLGSPCSQSRRVSS